MRIRELIRCQCYDFTDIKSSNFVLFFSFLTIFVLVYLCSVHQCLLNSPFVKLLMSNTVYNINTVKYNI